MGLLKAFTKYCLRSANTKRTNKKLEQVPAIAYNNVGNQFAENKKTGKYINGQKAYSKEKQKLTKQIKSHSENVSKFIDDI